LSQSQDVAGSVGDNSWRQRKSLHHQTDPRHSEDRLMANKGNVLNKLAARGEKFPRAAM
jgi:hypothetical protein